MNLPGRGKEFLHIRSQTNRAYDFGIGRDEFINHHLNTRSHIDVLPLGTGSTTDSLGASRAVESPANACIVDIVEIVDGDGFSEAVGLGIHGFDGAMLNSCGDDGALFIYGVFDGGEGT